MTLGQRHALRRLDPKPAAAGTHKFFDTDAGRNILFPHERADCTVRAVALAKALSYSDAHAALAKHAGRKPGRGAYFAVSAEELGFEVCENLVRPSVKTTLRHLPRSGRFVISTRAHVFAVVDGYVCDTFPPKLGNHVSSVYKAVKPSKL